MFSIIIPTYNNPDKLKRCLLALLNQTYPISNCEIIVIDDGSPFPAEASQSELIEKNPGIFYFFQQAHQGPSAARNLGISKAKKDLILFLDDDIYATEHLLESHRQTHLYFPERNTAVLGHVDWLPGNRPSGFMNWYQNSGYHFHYHRLNKNSLHANHWTYFYTCNISLKKAFLKEEQSLFDPGLPYAFEDTDLGYRLSKKGLSILINWQAQAYHDKFFTLKTALKRMKRVGRTAFLFDRKHPELNIMKTWFNNEKKPLDLLISRLSRSLSPIKTGPVENFLGDFYKYLLLKSVHDGFEEMHLGKVKDFELLD